MPYDAELHLWEIVPLFDLDGGRHVKGAVFNDTKGRFENGHMMRTSKIVSIDGETLRTKNSTYRLVPRDETMRMITAGIAVHRCPGAKVPPRAD